MICADCKADVPELVQLVGGIPDGELVCESCAAAPRCGGCFCRVADGEELCADCDAAWYRCSEEAERAYWQDVAEEGDLWREDDEP